MRRYGSSDSNNFRGFRGDHLDWSEAMCRQMSRGVAMTAWLASILCGAAGVLLTSCNTAEGVEEEQAFDEALEAPPEDVAW